ncbi:MAG: hypothetical protein GWN94_10545 [Phycisphaerae bacterium]|nr:hypothetical protein [Phycisphaerae bacterium]NIS51529.1 hypothetical protein [Phycisphaerae bacterium]
MKLIRFIIKIQVHVFLWLKNLPSKIDGFVERFFMASFWCKYTDHYWKEYHSTLISPHWRKCLRCDHRELDHNNGFGEPDWQPTNYGTSEWRKGGE